MALSRIYPSVWGPCCVLLRDDLLDDSQMRIFVNDAEVGEIHSVDDLVEPTDDTGYEVKNCTSWSSFPVSGLVQHGAIYHSFAGNAGDRYIYGYAITKDFGDGDVLLFARRFDPPFLLSAVGWDFYVVPRFEFTNPS